MMLLTASTLLVAVGVLDDKVDLSPKLRLLNQTLVALIACLGAGLVTPTLGDIIFMGDVDLGLLSIPFSVLVVITAINAFNFIDGLDGLTSGTALAAFVSTGVAGIMFAGDAVIVLSLVGVSVVIAFMAFNFPSQKMKGVRTFMGDAGATLLGLLVVWLGLSLCTGENASVSPIAALWIAAIPISDFFNCFVRRLSRGQHPMTADREHLHHQMLDAGLTQRQVMFVMTGLALALGLGALFAHRIGIPDGVLFAAMLVLCVFQNRIFGPSSRVWKLLPATSFVAPAENPKAG
ncbi:MAG: MraY family glycosyltransferase, partial [Pseudomonadales bacterium]